MDNETNCPNCGAPINNLKRKCEYCGTPYTLKMLQRCAQVEEQVTLYADNAAYLTVMTLNEIRDKMHMPKQRQNTERLYTQAISAMKYCGSIKRGE